MTAGGSGQKIWVVSDTHLIDSRRLPEALISKIKPTDILLHLGDIITLEVWEYFDSLCHVEGVAGNCDMPELKRKLKAKRTIELGGYKIGLIHGSGGVSQTLDFARREYGGKVDVLAFGHTHMPCNMNYNGTLFFNPGSLKNSRLGKNSYGVLHLDETPRGEVIEV